MFSDISLILRVIKHQMRKMWQ